MLRSASSQARCSCSSCCSRRACALLLGVEEQNAALGILAGPLLLQQLFPARMRTTVLGVKQNAALGILAGALFLQQLLPGAHAHYY